MAHDAPVYEVVPHDALPLLDLSRSVGGEIYALLSLCFPSRTRRVATSEPPPVDPILRLLQDPDAPVETIWRYRVALTGFVVGCLAAAIACFVSVTVGRVLAVLGLVFVTPFCTLNFAYLRFDMLMLVYTTYDFWFYSLVNVAGAWLISSSFNDARACIAGVVWLGNIHSILIDANTRFICYLNLVSLAVIVLNFGIILAIETHATEAWQPQTFRLRHGHEDTFMTNNLLSNALSTMTIIVARNAYRRHVDLVQQAKIGCAMLRCINYRCRITVVEIDAKRMAEIEGMTGKERVYYAPDCSHPFPHSRMYFICLPFLVYGSHTIFPVQLQPVEWSIPLRTGFVSLGVVGLGLTAAVFGLYPSPVIQPCAIVGLCCTVVFVGITGGLYHRAAFRAIVFGFDYFFLSLQLTLGVWCAAMLFRWDARAIALASMWFWLHWVITVDSLTPLMKQKIGVNTKLLVVPVLLLFIAAQAAIAVEIFWTNRWALNDRVLFTLVKRIDVRLLPCFISRLVMTFLWSLRLLWRILTSYDGDAIVQLGKVAYRYMTVMPTRPVRGQAVKDMAMVLKTTNRSATKGASSQVSNIPTAAQVAPVTAFGPE